MGSEKVEQCKTRRWVTGTYINCAFGTLMTVARKCLTRAIKFSPPASLQSAFVLSKLKMILYFMLCVFISVSSLLSLATIVSLLSSLAHNMDTVFFREYTPFERVSILLFSTKVSNLTLSASRFSDVALVSACIDARVVINSSS